MEQDKKTSTEVTLKNIDPISYFEQDADFAFAYKKTEKLASATYMVTNLFSDNEPMKWILRKKVSELLSFVVTYKDITKSGQSDFIYTAKTKILELVSLLEVASRGGLVSSMNFTIIKQEFSNLVEIFESSKSNKEVFGQNLSSAFLDASIANIQPKNQVNTGVVLHTTNTIKDTSVVKDKDVFKRSNRQNIILGLLKKKKELTIKDIAQVIKDCSEKTIQRELISFIQAGVLKRTGERRWSKYSLNN